jgi:LacI family transcriptional regulator
MQVCQEAGRGVPDDIAIIGVDDIPLARIIRPQLTTVHVDLTALGRTAMATLFDLIGQEEDSGPAALRIEPQLVVRDSA